MTRPAPRPMRPKRGWQTWGDAFNHYLDVRGFDHGYAAFRADEWLKRRQAREVRPRRRRKA